jgi:sporulation protein YlmC with PRC-barrel domain
MKGYITTICFLLFLCVIICVFVDPFGFFSSKSKKDYADRIDSLKAVVHFRELQIRRFKDTLKVKDVQISDTKKKVTEAEKTVSVYKKREWELKQRVPRSAKDTIVYFQAISQAADSVIVKEDSLTVALKSQLKETNDYLVLLDSAFNNSQLENMALKQSDSLRAVRIKELEAFCKKKKMKAGIVGFFLGYSAAKIF